MAVYELMCLSFIIKKSQPFTMYKFIIIIIIIRVWMNFIYRFFNYDHSIYDDIK